jgi:hypothetical protein
MVRGEFKYPGKHMRHKHSHSHLHTCMAVIFICSPLSHRDIASKRLLEIHKPEADEESYSLTHSVGCVTSSVRNLRKAKRNAAAKLLMSGWERWREICLHTASQPTHYCRRCVCMVLLPCLLVWRAACDDPSWVSNDETRYWKWNFSANPVSPSAAISAETQLWRASLFKIYVLHLFGWSRFHIEITKVSFNGHQQQGGILRHTYTFFALCIVMCVRRRNISVWLMQLTCISYFSPASPTQLDFVALSS